MDRYRIGVKPNENQNGGTPRIEEILGPLHNVFFNFPVEGASIPMIGLGASNKEGFSYEYFYNGRELTFGTYAEDYYIDDIVSFFQSAYRVVNVEKTDNIIGLDSEKILSDDYIVEYSNLYFPGLYEDVIPFYKHLQNDFLQLILTNLIKNKDIKVGYKVNFFPSNGDWKRKMKQYDKNKRNEKKGGFLEWTGKESIQMAEFESQMLQRYSEKILTPMSYFIEVQLIAYRKKVEPENILPTDKLYKKERNKINEKNKNEVESIIKSLNARLNDFGVSIKSSGVGLKEFLHNYQNNVISGKAFANGSIMSTHELVSIIHPPLETNISTPFLGIDKFKKIAIDKSLIDRKGVLLGVNQLGNKSNEFRMGFNERFRHMYIIGQTGTGKSVLTTQIALQDIYNGDGVCVIDPHGDLVEDILKHIPKNRIKDVVLFDPADVDRPPGFNIMNLNSDLEATLFTNNFIGMIKKMYENEEGATGPHFEDYMRTAIKTLYRMRKDFTPTVADIGRFLTSPDFLKKAIKYLDKDRDIDDIGYWTEHNNRIEQGTDYASEIIPYITTKLNIFVKNDIIKNIVAQENSTIDIKDIMDNKKILLLKLSKGAILEDSMKMLGLLFIQKILIETFKRDSIDPSKRTPFYLFVDEFQNFVTPEYASILSEARKYKLSLTMAHQFLDQLGGKDGKSEVKEAVFGNVGTMITFRIGGKDGEEFENLFANKTIITKDDFSNIDAFNAYIKTINVENIGAVTPFSVKTLQLKFPYNHDEQAIKNIKEYSKSLYCSTKEASQKHDIKFNEFISKK